MSRIFKNSRDQKLWNKIFGVGAVPPPHVRVEDLRENKDGTFGMILEVKEGRTKKYYILSHVKPAHIHVRESPGTITRTISFRRVRAAYVY